MRIAPRGPDGAGLLRDRAVGPGGRTVDVALIHHRLSIIDHAGGGQPMRSEAGRGGAPAPLVAIAFNGCIYNHRPLRLELAGMGYPFASDHSDTEVILHGYRAWGRGVFARLEGMWAVLIWDAARAELIAHRDRFGEKPLYRLAGASCEGAASDALGLARVAALAGDRRALVAPAAVASWLTFGHDPVTTPFTAVAQLPPGTGVTLPGGDVIAPTPLPAAPPVEARNAAALVAATEAAIDASVAGRLEADVPLGCFLSGGVDSSIVAALAARRIAGLTTLCVRMPDPRYDESRHAAAVASHIGTRHVTVDAEADPASDLVRLIGALGLPFADSSLLPTWWACRAARGHAKVMLSGDGGDELFLGYERHKAAPWLGRLRPLGFLAPLIPHAHGRSRAAKLRRLLEAARGAGYADLLALFPTPMALALGMSPPARVEVGSALDARGHDLAFTLPGDMLRKVDAASMLAGVEVRAPLLGAGVAALALGLPASALLLNGQRKGLLRAVARRHAPPVIVDRAKAGFAIPLAEWFRRDFGGLGRLLEDTLRTPDAFQEGLTGFSPPRQVVARMLEEHAAGTRDHTGRLYALLVLAVWGRGVRSAGG